jgi:hypothetical protein
LIEPISPLPITASQDNRDYDNRDCPTFSTILCNTSARARATVERYLFLLEQTYIIRLVRPFSRNLRSEPTKAPKLFFYDASLMQMLWLKRLQKEVLGPVFETSIFAELVKRYGAEQIHFWRTQDKKEIDFIISLPEDILSVETKLHFPRNMPPALRLFAKTYQVQNRQSSPYRLVGLKGQPMEDGMVYPWQV